MPVECKIARFSFETGLELSNGVPNFWDSGCSKN